MGRVHEATSQANFDTLLHPADYVRLLIIHFRWWAIPTIAFALIAGAYSVVAPRNWKATQALIIRPEVASVSEEKLGKFADLSEMKTLQETILEIAKSQIVVQATLHEVGPPSNYRHRSEWPTALDVEAFRECIDMRPPGGSEFGKTEVFYLTIGDSNRQRASALVVALCNQLEFRLKTLREENANGMIAELQRTVEMADGDLAAQISELTTFEAKVGADLGELRNLNADVGSQSEVSQLLQAIDSERRANEARLDECKQLLNLLLAAQGDSRQLLATPNSLLVSQPSVSQLKNALVSAQLRTADLLGSRSENHPFVRAARESENSIRSQLNNEIAVAIRGLEVDIDLCVNREKSLSAKHQAARSRMSGLAAFRAEYANIASSVQNHTRLVETARKNLADARARLAGAHSASVISRIDGVNASVRPAGPSRKAVAAAGGVSGMLLGFGLVFLFASPSTNCMVVAKPIGNVATTGVVAAEKPNAVRPRSASESFGLFRGMSLQEALRAVERRNK